MHKGHLRPWSTAMAFSDENSSLGRPQMFHCLILTASPRAADRLNLGLQGTPAAPQAATQPAKQSDLCTDVKGPAQHSSTLVNQDSALHCLGAGTTQCMLMQMMPSNQALWFALALLLRWYVSAAHGKILQPLKAVLQEAVLHLRTDLASVACLHVYQKTLLQTLGTPAVFTTVVMV